MRSQIVPIVIVLYNVWTPSRSLGTTESDDTYKERPINIFFAADHFFREMTGDELQKYAESLLAGVTISTNPEWMDLPCSLRLRVSAVHMLSDKEEAILLPKLTLYDSDGTQREYVDDTAYSAGHPPRMEDILEDSYHFSAADIVVILTGHPTVSGNPYYSPSVRMCTDSKFILVRDLPYAHSAFLFGTYLPALMSVMGGSVGSPADWKRGCRQIQDTYRKALAMEDGHHCHSTSVSYEMPSFAFFYKFNATQYCRAVSRQGDEFYEAPVTSNCKMCRDKAGDYVDIDGPEFCLPGDLFKDGPCINETVLVYGRQIDEKCSVGYGVLGMRYLLAWGMLDKYPSYIDDICDIQQSPPI